MSVLVLGGTAEARALAQELHTRDVSVVSSLAGAVRRPRLPMGEVRIGGFGGVPGLFAYLRETDTRVVIDATHPFADRISANAAAACAEASMPLLRLERPGWTDHPLATTWAWVTDHDAAARAAAGQHGPVLLTTGRRHLERFVAPLAEHRVLVRVVDPVEIELPPNWEVRESRGPYDLDSERDLLHKNGVRVLVTKDSGGEHTVAKLLAAHDIGAHTVVVRRPPAAPGVATVTSVLDAVAWVSQQPT